MNILSSAPTLAQALLPHVPFGWKLTSWEDPATWDTVIQLIRTGGPAPIGQRFSHRVTRQQIADDHNYALGEMYIWMRKVTETAAADWTEEVLLTEAAKGVDWVGGGTFTGGSGGVTFGGGGVGTGQGPVIVPRRKVEPPVEIAPAVPGARRIDLDD